jgi:hypothetical protein
LASRLSATDSSSAVITSARTRPKYLSPLTLRIFTTAPPIISSKAARDRFAAAFSMAQRLLSSGASTPRMRTLTRIVWPGQTRASATNVSPSMTRTTWASTGPGMSSAGAAGTARSARGRTVVIKG